MLDQKIHAQNHFLDNRKRIKKVEGMGYIGLTNLEREVSGLRQLDCIPMQM